MSSMKAIRRCLSSCLELTRIWRSTERASLEKKPSMRLSHDPCVGVNVKVKRPMGCAASQLVVSRETWAEWLSRITSMAVSKAGVAVEPSSDRGELMGGVMIGDEVDGEIDRGLRIDGSLPRRAMPRTTN